MRDHVIPINRLFTETDADRVDDLGFLDRSRTPRLLRFEAILAEPLAWILGPPWLGKSTVANSMWARLRVDPAALGGVEHRICLTRLGMPSADNNVLPFWWAEWCQDNKPRPAVWLIDGVDEGLDRSEHLFELILRAVDRAPADHLRQLRLILFSRPHAELGDFQKELQRRYAGISRRADFPRFWLARLDRDAAEQLVGAERFPYVLDMIQRNDLQPVAGYPVVLRYLTRYSETASLSVSQVWRGILTALLGERQSNRRTRFDTELTERFDAACRIAAVLTLTRRDTIREYSPDPAVPTIGTLFQHPDNRPLDAAREACQTAAFVAFPEQGAFRFAQRNVQDWFAAFALERLPFPTLRFALAGPDGALAARLREPARLIRTLTDRPEVRTEIDRLGGGILLPSDAAEPTLTEAIRCLDQLEELARNAPWGVRLGDEQQDELARLRVDGLSGVLAARLREPARPPQVKRLLIDVAEATNALEAIDAAVELVLDPLQHDEVRYEAIWLITRFGGDVYLQLLQTPIGERAGNSEIEYRLRGVLILELLNRGLWAVWQAAVHAPAVNPHLIDSRGLLLNRLEDRLTVEDARQLLPHLLTLYERHVDNHHPDRLPKFLDRAIELVTQQKPSDPRDIEQMFQFALQLAKAEFRWSTARSVAIRLRPFVTARRRFYEHDIEVIRNGQDDRRIAAHSLLMPEDWRWLRDQALGPWADMRQVWDHAYGMAHMARGEGQVTETEWQEFVTLVEQHAPGLPAQFEEEVRQHELERQQQEAERREAEERDPTCRSLAERVTRVLEHPGLGPDDRMRKLGSLCFSRVVGLDARAIGQWDELPTDLQRRILDACRRGLEVAQPTPIPPEDSFPYSILGEGAAFSQVVCSPDHTSWLTDPMIRRWLPTALFACMSSSWTELIRACWAISPTATESVLIEAMADQARRYEQPSQLRTIPSECWTEGMANRVVLLLQDVAIRPRSRRELLEQLVACSPEQADPIAADWGRRPVVAEDMDQLRQGGRNVLLACNPIAAFDLIESDFAIRGTAALEELSALWGWRDSCPVRWEQWPPGLLERLGQLLLTGYPPANDPEPQGGRVTPDQELRQIRGRLINVLLQRPDPEAQAALDRLAELDPTIRAWVATHRASEQANRLVPTFDPTASRDPAALSVLEAVRILDRAGYRLIRSADDLLDAVMEALRRIGEEVGYDLPMLYEAPKRTAKGGESKKRRERLREHLHEDALQAYLRRRLHELLPQIVDGVKVLIVREDQVARRQRLDLRVTAPCHGTSCFATVVIEVKWSTNDETRNGLVDQLGERYLRGEGLTHGIFLVGWSGEWRPSDGSGVNTDAGALERHLTDQRDDYCWSGQPGAGLRIEPFVLDVRWRQMDK